jgi:hypothetical protein
MYEDTMVKLERVRSDAERRDHVRITEIVVFRVSIELTIITGYQASLDAGD